jgi:hypothetical protein
MCRLTTEHSPLNIADDDLEQLLDIAFEAIRSSS